MDLEQKRVVILASGNGGTARFLYNIFKVAKLNFKMVGIVADRECGAINFGKKVGIYTRVIKYNRTRPKELTNELKELNPDIIITNFHKIIDSDNLNLFPDCFINLHYSLLPAYEGVIGLENIIEKAKAQNVRFMGGTSHIVDASTDGGIIIQQFVFPVDWLNAESVGDTIFKASCISLLSAILIKSGIQIEPSNSMQINDRQIHFSPDLPFSTSLFSEISWDILLA